MTTARALLFYNIKTLGDFEMFLHKSIEQLDSLGLAATTEGNDAEIDEEFVKSVSIEGMLLDGVDELVEHGLVDHLEVQTREEETFFHALVHLHAGVEDVAGVLALHVVEHSGVAHHIHEIRARA